MGQRVKFRGKSYERTPQGTWITRMAIPFEFAKQMLSAWDELNIIDVWKTEPYFMPEWADNWFNYLASFHPRFSFDGEVIHVRRIKDVYPGQLVLEFELNFLGREGYDQ